MKLNFSFSTKKLFREAGALHPMRDWYLLLLGGLVVTLFFVLVALYFYLGLHSGIILSSSTEEDLSSRTVSREILTDMVNRFETIEVNYETQNIRTPNVADPR